MSERILAYIRQERRGTTYALLARYVPGFDATGDQARHMLGSAKYNTWQWATLSAEGVTAMQYFIRKGIIDHQPVEALVYWVDGKVPRMPVAKRVPKKGYKEPRWVPTVITVDWSKVLANGAAKSEQN